MKKILFPIAVLVFTTSSYAEVLNGQYELKSSRIDYVVKYLIKKAEGTSTTAKGKGECKEKSCDFLVAAPVKSFESKDSNRDLNMLKTTKADKYSMVIARIKAPSDLSADFKTDVELEFAGEKHMYKGVVFKTNGNAQGFHAEGKINVSLNNHKIERPSLLGVEVEDNLPVSISADWIQRKN